MAVPRVREKIVRARAAIFPGALLDDRGSDRRCLRCGDMRRTIECLVVPGVAQRVVRPVYLRRTGNDAVVVAGELQGFMHTLSTAGRAPEEIRVSRALAVEGFDDLLGAHRHQMGRSRTEVDLLLAMAGQHAATKRVS